MQKLPSQVDRSEFVASESTSDTSLKRGLEFPAFEMLGIRTQAITAPDLLSIVSTAVVSRSKYVVANHNLHSLYLWHHDPAMRALYERANFTHVDGMALIALSRILGSRLERKHRTTYVDFWPLLGPEAVRQSWRIYYLGSKPQTVENGARRLRKSYVGLQIRTHHGFFNVEGEENEAVLADIRAFRPHVLMVGMGMPRQEIWVEANLPKIETNIFFCVGCLMNYIAGDIPTCPRWLAAMGFEWLYRLLSEPARLWHRYLVEPWFILGRFANAYFGWERAVEVSEPGFEKGNQ